MSLRLSYFYNAILSRPVLLLSVAGAVVLAAVGVGTSTSYGDAIDVALPAVAAGLLLANAFSRIELRQTSLCIVNIATVSCIERDEITAVISRPAVAVHTATDEYGSTMFSASLSGRLSSCRMWDWAADIIEQWRGGSVAASTDHGSRRRPRWELLAYMSPFLLLNSLLAVASAK
jgi:hypothetical protein